MKKTIILLFSFTFSIGTIPDSYMKDYISKSDINKIENDIKKIQNMINQMNDNFDKIIEDYDAKVMELEKKISKNINYDAKVMELEKKISKDIKSIESDIKESNQLMMEQDSINYSDISDLQDDIYDLQDRFASQKIKNLKFQKTIENSINSNQASNLATDSELILSELKEDFESFSSSHKNFKKIVNSRFKRIDKDFERIEEKLEK